MRRPMTFALVLTASATVLGAALPATAQSSDGAATGLRYLSWPGKPTRQPEAAPVAAETPMAAAPMAAAPTSPGRPPVIPHGGYRTADAATPAQGLTPASAWMSPQPPAYAPQPRAGMASTPPPYTPVPAPAAAPRPVARVAERPAPPEAALTVATPPPPPAPAPMLAERRLDAGRPSAPAEAPPAAAPVEAPYDAMAPRRDAPIFRLQRPQGQPAPVEPTQDAASAPAPSTTSGGSRYYSVHRQAGRQPDAAPTPAPVYLDAMPIDLDRTPSSTDLAEPPAAPNLIRNANGRVQALVPNEDPSLP